MFPELTDEDIFLLGSTGQKADSGDIDICVDARNIQGNILENLLKFSEHCAKNCNLESYVNTFSYDMVHVKFPQENAPNKFVQVDFMMTKNPSFVKFTMTGDVVGTKYKLAHRNVLLNAILYVISNVILKTGSDGEILKWKQLFLDKDKISMKTLSLVDADGSRLMWENKPLSEDYAVTESSMTYLTDPDAALAFMVGKKFKASDIDSFEKLYKIIAEDQNFNYKHFSAKILDRAKKMFSISSKLDVPTELN